jgi:hypothetical protein
VTTDASKELMGAYRILLAFEIFVKGTTILLCSDNTTVIAYINNGGGTSRTLTEIAKRIWLLGVKIELQNLY